MVPKVIYGTANFHMGVETAEAAQSILDVALKHDVVELDTGARYPPVAPGQSETLIGQLDAVKQGFAVDTKILAGRNKDGSGELSRENIDDSLTHSLRRLGVGKVNILYCHRPDPATPLAEQAAAFDEQYKQGRFHALGVSNFEPSMIQEWMKLCDAYGYVKPKVYQGDYNLLTRGMEESLLPVLRQHGMSFYAFRPMAAGFLSGSLVSGKTEGTRFSNEHVGAQMTQLFNSDELKQAYSTLEKAIKHYDIPVRAVSLRWMAHHSALGDGDGIILGASKPVQLDENLLAIAQGPLPRDIVQSIEDIWLSLKASRGTII